MSNERHEPAPTATAYDLAEKIVDELVESNAVHPMDKNSCVQSVAHTIVRGGFPVPTGAGRTPR